VQMLPYESVYFMMYALPFIVLPAFSVATKYRVVFLL
jgi:hypothetical protein